MSGCHCHDRQEGEETPLPPIAPREEDIRSHKELTVAVDKVFHTYPTAKLNVPFVISDAFNRLADVKPIDIRNAAKVYEQIRVFLHKGARLGQFVITKGKAGVIVKTPIEASPASQMREIKTYPGEVFQVRARELITNAPAFMMFNSTRVEAFTTTDSFESLLYNFLASRSGDTVSAKGVTTPNAPIKANVAPHG